MENESLLELLERLRSRSHEGIAVEFKSNLNEPAEIGQYISALANSAALDGESRAWLVWGVADATHEVIGTSFDENEPGKPRVEVMIPGQVLDMKYTQLLMKRSDLDLRQVLLLDSVQKKTCFTRRRRSCISQTQHC